MAEARIVAPVSDDWILHIDADEWLCPPWPGTRLVEALERSMPCRGDG